MTKVTTTSQLSLEVSDAIEILKNELNLPKDVQWESVCIMMDDGEGDPRDDNTYPVLTNIIFKWEEVTEL